MANPVIQFIEKCWTKKPTQEEILALLFDPDTPLTNRAISELPTIRYQINTSGSIAVKINYRHNGMESQYSITFSVSRNGGTFTAAGMRAQFTGAKPVTLVSTWQYISLAWLLVSKRDDKPALAAFIKAHIAERDLVSPYNSVMVVACIAYLSGQGWSHTQQKKWLDEVGAVGSGWAMCSLTKALVLVDLLLTDKTTVNGERKNSVNLDWHYSNIPYPEVINYYNEIPDSAGNFFILGFYTGDSPLVRIISGEETIHYPHEYATKLGYTHECSECKTLSLKPVMTGEQLCLVCIQNKYPNLGVRDYSTDPLKHLSFTVSVKKDTPFPKLSIPVLLGCELEYNCKDRNSINARITLMRHLKDHIIFKRDGSLDENGFEVVTAPATKEIHFEKFKPTFSEFPSCLVTGEKVGMHIHLDRKVLTPLLLGRMVDFMNRPENIEFIQIIGERKLNSYCAANSDKSWGYVINNAEDRGARGVTLNLCKRPTVEFRIFKSPVTFDSFAKNLEFVVMLLNYYKTGTLNLTPKQTRYWEGFVEFIKNSNKSRDEARCSSPYLAKHLKTKGVI